MPHGPPNHRSCLPGASPCLTSAFLRNSQRAGGVGSGRRFVETSQDTLAHQPVRVANGFGLTVTNVNYAIVAVGGLALLASHPTVALAGSFFQTNLVTNNQSVTPAENTDPNLVNPWGHLLQPH